MATTKIDWIGKFPWMFLFGMAGLVLGAMGGALFSNIGYASFIPWEEITMFFGALFGVLAGYRFDF